MSPLPPLPKVRDGRWWRVADMDLEILCTDCRTPERMLRLAELERDRREDRRHMNFSEWARPISPEPPKPFRRGPVARLMLRIGNWLCRMAFLHPEL